MRTWKQLVEIIKSKGGVHHTEGNWQVFGSDYGTTKRFVLKYDTLTLGGKSLKHYPSGDIIRNEKGFDLTVATNIKVKEAFKYFGVE